MPDTLLNMKAFLATARLGSFSEAARQLGVATSVATKRVNQLEWALNAKLLKRSTRSVKLTDIGDRYLGAIRDMVAEYDDMVAGIRRSPDEIEGHIRIKTPTALTAAVLGRVYSAFLKDHPRVTLDVVLTDRSVNPVEEGFDLAIGILPAPYDGVVEEPLHAYPRLVVASPDYLRRRGAPSHPRDLINHECLTFAPAGPTWTFQSARGNVSVTVRPRLVTNDTKVLTQAACDGNGIAVVSKVVALDALRAGALVPLLPDFPVPDLWLRAMVPTTRLELARVQALLARIRSELLPIPFWQDDGTLQAAE